MRWAILLKYNNWLMKMWDLGTENKLSKLAGEFKAK
jgi:hypothetical protein